MPEVRPDHFSYPLTIGLPHTNLNGLAEPQLLMHAGHFQWTSIARALQKPLSALRTSEGHTIYATYYYVEQYYPRPTLLSQCGLEQDLLFVNRLRHFKGVSIDGDTVFDRKSTLEHVPDPFAVASDGVRVHPYLRMCNVFISREKGNESLKISPPQGVVFDAMGTLPLEQNAYALVREAGRALTFGLIPPEWRALDKAADFFWDHAINPDRDTNGAGLVYFANYAAFIDTAERVALRDNSTKMWTPEQVNGRALHQRKLAYFANIGLEDTLRIHISLFAGPGNDLGTRARLTRLSDGKLVALSEAIKVI